MAAYRRVYDSHHLQADYQDQLRNPTVGNRVWAATFTFFMCCEQNLNESSAGSVRLCRRRRRCILGASISRSAAAVQPGGTICCSCPAHLGRSIYAGCRLDDVRPLRLYTDARGTLQNRDSLVNSECRGYYCALGRRRSDHKVTFHSTVHRA